MLETERQFLEKIRPTLASLCPGTIVLIKGEELIGTYNTMQEALIEGARRFGLAPFLARRADEPTTEISIPALTLGLLRAPPSHPVGSSGEHA